MKFCMNCGTKLEEGDLFCRGCGTRIAETPSAGASASDPYQGNKPSDPYGQQQAGSYGQTQQTPYGQQQTGSYGQTQQTPYGQQQAGSYGQTQAGSYGQTQQTPYGQQQTGYYGQNPQNPYGQQAGYYGQNPQNPYGQQTGSYGQTQQTPYGQQQTGSYTQGAAYGGAAGAAAGSYAAGKQKKAKKAVRTGTPGRAGNGKKIGIIAGAIAAVIALCVAAVFFLPGPRNLFKRMFSSPEKYYQYVEGQAVKELAGDAASSYENVLRSNLNVDDRGIGYNIDVALSDQAKSLLAQYAQDAGAGSVDLNWLGSVALSGRIDSKNGKSLVTSEALLNGTKVVSANVIADLNGNAVYGQIPELSPDYVAGDVAAVAGYGPAQALTMLRSFYKACPDEKTAERLLSKYLNVVVEDINEVQKSSKRLSAGTISTNYTALDVTIENSTVLQILRDVADLAENDDELRSVVSNFVSASGIPSPARVYDQLIAQIRQIANTTEPLLAYPLNMTVWVDGNGEIRGRTIAMNGTEFFRAAMPKSGSSVGLDVELISGGRSIGINGNGSESKNTLSGDFSVTYTDYGPTYEVLKVSVASLSIDEAKKGFLNGKYTVSPGRELAALALSNGLPGAAVTMFLGFSFDVESTASKDNTSAVIGVNFNGNPLGTVTMSAAGGSANDFQMISSAKTPDRYMQDLDRSGLSGIVSSLRSAGLPAQYADLLEQYLAQYT